MATAAVCGLILEPSPNGPDSGRKAGKYVRWALVALWIIVPLGTLECRKTAANGLRFVPRNAIGHPRAELVLGALSIEERAHSNLPVPGWEDRTVRGKTILEAANTARENVAGPLRLRPPHFVSYGEPAIVFHLNARGMDAAPVRNLGFLAAGQAPVTQPAFLMGLPNSRDEFKRLIAPYSDRLDVVAIYDESPSNLVLLDTYPPSDLTGVGGRPLESLRLYRIKAP